MAINRDFIGRTFDFEVPYQVGREKVREFATAIGDNNPLFHDLAAAQAAGHRDLLAPPTFPFVITYRAMIGAMGDPELNLNYAMVVHGEQKFTYTRPLYAGDEVIVDSVVADIAAVGRNELLTMEQHVKTLDGELIVTTRNVTVSRGTAPQEG
ncbi:MAG: MaoC family dehydratase N-terminal domain-containing protein [Candidatus Nanopelagicales bacterium]